MLSDEIIEELLRVATVFSLVQKSKEDLGRLEVKCRAIARC